MKSCARALFLLGLVIMLAACSSYLFYPQKRWQLAPEAQGYHYQLLDVRADDGQVLNAMLMPHRGERLSGAILFFHGNDGNVSVYARQVYWLTDHGYDVVLVDYRGYGLSGGQVDLDMTIADIATVLQWFYLRYNDTPTFMMAHSLGASMSGYVMATRPDLRQSFKAVVLDAGFAEYRRMMRDAMNHNWLTWLLRYPASLGMPDDYDLLDVVDQIAPTPLMIVHGSQDPVVPYAHALDLYGKAGSPKTFIGYEGQHNDAWDDQQRRQMLLDFLARNQD